MITSSSPMKSECLWARRAAGCRQVSQNSFQLQMLALMERLVDAAALLCFCSKRLSRAEGPCAERGYYCE